MKYPEVIRVLGVAAFAVAIFCTAARAQYTQFGGRLAGNPTGNSAQNGQSVAISADGQTMIFGAPSDPNDKPVGPFVFARTGNGPWLQQGPKLAATGRGPTLDFLGFGVAISGDGNTVAAGDFGDENGKGAVWVWVRSGGTWTQQGGKLVGSNSSVDAFQGSTVALSADGNTLLIGGTHDNSTAGAAWVFTRSNGVWTQQGGKLVPNDGAADARFGSALALSADGNTAAIGGATNNFTEGGVWVFVRNNGTWTQQGSKLVGSGAIGQLARQGNSVALSADGNTLIEGGSSDGSITGHPTGAAWVFVRNGTTWAQQGGKLVGTGAGGDAMQGYAVALSASGDIAAIGGPTDRDIYDRGAVWIFKRTGTTWSQVGTKFNTPDYYGSDNFGNALAYSKDANTLAIGAYNFGNGAGGVWTFVQTDFLTSPASNISTAGHVGGPFLAPSFDYTLSAVNADTNYTVAGVPSWLTASSTAGTVTSNTSKPLTFTVNGSASSLPPGTHGPTNITITNTTNGKGNRTISATLTVGNDGGASVVSAVLPASRSVQVGAIATAFATIINTSGAVASSCGLGIGGANPLGFRFQTTDPATNAVTGSLNAPVNVPAGQAQSFVFAVTPSAAFLPTDLPIIAGCTNSAPAESVVGLNTLLLSASNTPVPDIVALAATAGNDGIVNVAGANGTGAFAVASVNVGIAADITATADTGSASLPVALSLCQTNPGTGQCTSQIGPSVTTSILANATPTFAIFLQGSGTVPFDPAHNRIFVRFKDTGGVVRGATSVAVRTQ